MGIYIPCAYNFSYAYLNIFSILSEQYNNKTYEVVQSIMNVGTGPCDVLFAMKYCIYLKVYTHILLCMLHQGLLSTSRPSVTTKQQSLSENYCCLIFWNNAPGGIVRNIWYGRSLLWLSCLWNTLVLYAPYVYIAYGSSHEGAAVLLPGFAISW